MAGILQMKRLPGQKVDKKVSEMIRKCQHGEIDMILTKSISRFQEYFECDSVCTNASRQTCAILFEREY